MIDSTQTQARIGRLAWATAWFALLFGQLHAMARHQTVDGREDLQSGIVRAWSDPGRRIFRPLLDWGSPDTVYLTYGKVWLFVFLVFTLAAFVVRKRRVAAGAVHGAEKWAWRLALTTYVLATISVGVEYWTQWGAMNDDLLDVVFLATVPVLLAMVLATTFLGVVLLRRGLGLPAWLLALQIPLMFGISAVTSLGNVVLPLCFAFGILGRRLATRETADAPTAYAVRT
jgi:hypothetical protein